MSLPNLRAQMGLIRNAAVKRIQNSVQFSYSQVAHMLCWFVHGDNEPLPLLISAGWLIGKPHTRTPQRSFSGTEICCFPTPLCRCSSWHYWSELFLLMVKSEKILFYLDNFNTFKPGNCGIILPLPDTAAFKYTRRFDDFLLKKKKADCWWCVDKNRSLNKVIIFIESLFANMKQRLLTDHLD